MCQAAICMSALPLVRRHRRSDRQGRFRIRFMFFQGRLFGKSGDRHCATRSRFGLSRCLAVVRPLGPPVGVQGTYVSYNPSVPQDMCRLSGLNQATKHMPCSIHEVRHFIYEKMDIV
jgi:hypothetical protein